MTELELLEWVNAQRIAYQDGDLADWQISDLESVEGWSWEISDRIMSHGPQIDLTVTPLDPELN